MLVVSFKIENETLSLVGGLLVRETVVMLVVVVLFRLPVDVLCMGASVVPVVLAVVFTAFRYWPD